MRYKYFHALVWDTYSKAQSTSEFSLVRNKMGMLISKIKEIYFRRQPVHSQNKPKSQIQGKRIRRIKPGYRKKNKTKVNFNKIQPSFILSLLFRCTRKSIILPKIQ